MKYYNELPNKISYQDEYSERSIVTLPYVPNSHNIDKIFILIHDISYPKFYEIFVKI